jgi:hypothetical protein
MQDKPTTGPHLSAKAREALEGEDASHFGVCPECGSPGLYGNNIRR